MTDKQKITEILKAYTKKHNISASSVILEEYAEELVKQGVIVPPCKVGDMVYVVENPYTFLPLSKVLEGEVTSIHQREHGLYLRVIFDTKKINGCVDYNLEWKLNKTVFLTKEEAEEKLRECEG